MKFWYMLQNVFKDEPWKHYARWNMLDTKRQILWSHVYEAPRIVKFIETENRIEVTRGWGEEEWGGKYSISSDSVWEDEKVLNIDGGDDCMTHC